MATRNIEGVTYYRFVVRFRLLDGRRRRWVRWSPGFPWVRQEVERELDELDDVDVESPVTITLDDPPLRVVRSPRKRSRKGKRK